MHKWKTWEEETLRNIRKMLTQVERTLEEEDLQACGNKDGALLMKN